MSYELLAGLKTNSLFYFLLLIFIGVIMGKKLPKTPEAARNRAKTLREQADNMEKRAVELAKKKKACPPPKALKAAESRLAKAQKNLDKVKGKCKKVSAS
ncbi:MAG: hypothetical protein U0264_05310 [Candidatus Kapaibacterium sp.]